MQDTSHQQLVRALEETRRALEVTDERMLKYSDQVASLRELVRDLSYAVQQLDPKKHRGTHADMCCEICGTHVSLWTPVQKLNAGLAAAYNSARFKLQCGVCEPEGNLRCFIHLYRLHTESDWEDHLAGKLWITDQHLEDLANLKVATNHLRWVPKARRKPNAKSKP